MLSLEGSNPNQGTRVLTRHQHPGHHVSQLWYDDNATGTIRSRLNDFCLNWDGKHVTLYTAQHTRRYPVQNLIIVSANMCSDY